MTARRTGARPVVIEIVGPAGAGKSAVARWVVDNDPTICVVPRARPRRDLTSYLAAGLRLAPVAAEALVCEPRFAREQFRHLVRLETLRARLDVATGRTAGAVLFDEGPLYSLARLRAFWPERLSGGRVDEHLDRALSEWVPALDLVIRLDARNAVLSQRIDMREKDHRMRGRGDDAVFHFLERYRAAYAGLLRDVSEAGTVAIVDIDTGTVPIAESGARVIEAIRTRMFGGDGAGRSRRAMKPAGLRLVANG